MRSLPFALVLALLVSSCRSGQKFSSDDDPLHIGDIAPDPALDDSTFTVCRESYIPQYYSIKSGFEGEKTKLEAELRKRFSKNKKNGNENGFVTIRFVVNCQGKTGRFRVQEMGQDLRPKQFPKDITGQLLEAVKTLKGWQPGQYDDSVLDYYQYLTFKIAGGDIAEILP